jgi:basic membrane lipoprotein Med (substrate-binding protein (PBP1-ABC) superfamily)
MHFRVGWAVFITIFALLGAASCGDGGDGAAGLGPYEGAKIGFLFVGARDDLGYNQAAWEGSEAVARAFPDLVVLREENVPETGVAERVMERMVDEGARILFPTSFGHLRAAVAVARRHRDVVVVHQGGLEPVQRLDNLGTYFGAVYEPVYEAGIVAGAAAPHGDLGFVAAFPIPATFNNVNAFTLGARSVNPSATTRVVFTGAWCDPGRQAQAAAALLAQGVEVITQHQDCSTTILRAAEAAGVRSVGYHYDGSETAPQGWLVGSVWDWRGLFIDIVNAVVAGRFADSPYNGDFRGGLRTGDNPFVLTELGPAADPRTAPLVAAADARFRAGGFPFEGPLVDRDGRPRVAAGAAPSQEEIDRMDWFVAGVIGDIPH